jgi:hypothetical protein
LETNIRQFSPSAFAVLVAGLDLRDSRPLYYCNVLAAVRFLANWERPFNGCSWPRVVFARSRPYADIPDKASGKRKNSSLASEGRVFISMTGV